MDENATPDSRRRPERVSDANWEEAMARARLKRMRAKPAFQPRNTLGRQIRAITRAHLKGHGSTIAKLKDDWSSIVGEEMASYCRPEKMSGPKTGRILTLRVLPAAAVLIQHQEEVIRQRVSVRAGGNITSLKLVQGPFSKGAVYKKQARRPLSAEEKTHLENSLQKIENPALKQAIAALGRAVLTENQ